MRNKKALIIGGGIAGLCTGVYVQKNGFETEILEMHSIAGGLATAWKRNGYTFENCIHWLLGSKEGKELNATCVTPPGFSGETVGHAPAFWVPLTMQDAVYPGRDLLTPVLGLPE